MKAISIRSLLVTAAITTLAGCVVVPTGSHRFSNKCEISSDRKTLRIVNVAKETNTYYSVSGLILTPVLVPATALLSATYVAANNIYNLGEEKIKCGQS